MNEKEENSFQEETYLVVERAEQYGEAFSIYLARAVEYGSLNDAKKIKSTFPLFWKNMQKENPMLVSLEVKEAWDNQLKMENSEFKESIEKLPENIKLVIVSAFCMGYASAKLNYFKKRGGN